MRLTALHLTHWLNQAKASFQLAPLSVICGPNHSGKSAVGDAVAFALTGELRRITAKGDRDQLITDGCSGGQVSLVCEDTVITRAIGTGKLANPGRKVPLPPTAVVECVPYVLDHSRFARAAPDERRKVLRLAMRADLGPDAILAVLLERRHPAALVQQLKPAQALADWILYADRMATESRGAWKAITGEPYGVEKAADYVMPGPEIPPELDDAPALAAAHRMLQEDAHLLHRELGTLDAAEARAAERAGRVATLQAAADNSLSAAALLDAAEREWTRIATLRDAEASRGRELAARADTACLHCPDCGVALDLVDRALLRHKAPADPSSPAEREASAIALAALEAELRTANTEKTAAKNKHSHAVASADALQNLPPLPDPPTSDRLEIERHLMLAEAAIAAKADLLAKATALAQSTAAAVDATKRAATAHRTVLQWLAIKAALAPDGIPGEILARVLVPFNEHLRELATATGWSQVTVGEAMDIRAGGRLHHLLSRSEQWRSDAMLTVAIAVHSELCFVLLDELDVIEVSGRRPALGWLYGLTETGELDSVIVMATLQSPPQVPAKVAMHWLGRAPDAGQAAVADSKRDHHPAA